MTGTRSNRLAGLLRAALVALVIIAQILLVLFLVHLLQERALFLYFLIQLVAVINIFILVGKHQNTSYTMAWIVLILLLPVTGLLLYILWGKRGKHRRVRSAIARSGTFLQKDPEIYQSLGEEHPRRKRLGGYLGRMGFPLYQNTSCAYYPLGDDQFPAMFQDLEGAERFIFLSTFILSQGKLWNQVREILARKAASGVEVRIMYDDLGSLLTLPEGLEEDLNALGIQLARFNPIQYATSRLYLNYRNHQKICVIDGAVAYTGGTNIADEYANYISRLGHWKDTAIRLQGDAVWSMTVFFLQMWEAQTQTEQDYDRYRPLGPGQPAPGYFQPFTDGPMNNPDNPAETMYRSMIYNAREYVYISTPYLVIDNSMVDALCTAAMGGTDVRIITPRIWDKWVVHVATQSNYAALLKAGVRIYEYTPGFMHAKTILSDDEHCITGSINMDYRSFYLHYENGVWICGAPVIQDIKADFLATIARCQEMDPDIWQSRPFHHKVLQGFFRLFAIFL